MNSFADRVASLTAEMAELEDRIEQIRNDLAEIKGKRQGGVEENLVPTEERQRAVLEEGLRRICTAGSLVPGDPLDDAYRDAGGGYGGLQAIAVKALEMAGISRLR